MLDGSACCTLERLNPRSDSLGVAMATEEVRLMNGNNNAISAPKIVLMHIVQPIAERWVNYGGAGEDGQVLEYTGCLLPAARHLDRSTTYDPPLHVDE